VHRLDANTEGIVVFARNEGTAARYEALFFRHELKKTYHAIVRGTPPKSGRLVNWVKKDAEESFVSICGENDPDALRCELTYRVIRSDGEKSLLEIELMTGRTHQIRVQMAAAGYPVLGDDKYGDRAFNKAQKTQNAGAARQTSGARRPCVRELARVGTIRNQKRFSTEKRFVFHVGFAGRAALREFEGGALGVS
jgi:23S rRNA pseudouridine1911/1915/1917 synthase